MHETTLTRQTGVPLWRQVAMRLAHEIQAGADPRLPSEQALARRFGVNRHTVRQAIRSLAEQGLVRAEQGRGTFVADLAVDYPIGPRTRFTASLRAQDLEPSRVILGCATLPADEDVAAALAIDPGAEIVRVRSLTFADGIPLALGAWHVATARFPDATLAFGRAASVTEALAARGITDYRRISTRVLARLPEPAEALPLRQPLTAPVLVSEGVDVDAQGHPLAFSVAVWAAERVQFVIDS